ncbi:hypothetical protein SAMN05216275_113205 [Streptosporangium canum]|uniref:Uncharacterized protein n=1 Tax=Streptosporangium canum TaxID=324952 RepID=A0A1I3V649_9ACTN|nr:hypothetical protein SAMN05216275_113205 [Streptosporangium canum]
MACPLLPAAVLFSPLHVPFRSAGAATDHPADLVSRLNPVAGSATSTMRPAQVPQHHFSFPCQIRAATTRIRTGSSDGPAPTARQRHWPFGCCSRAEKSSWSPGTRSTQSARAAPSISRPGAVPLSAATLPRPHRRPRRPHWAKVQADASSVQCAGVIGQRACPRPSGFRSDRGHFLRGADTVGSSARDVASGSAQASGWAARTDRLGAERGRRTGRRHGAAGTAGSDAGHRPRGLPADARRARQQASRTGRVRPGMEDPPGFAVGHRDRRGVGLVGDHRRRPRHRLGLEPVRRGRQRQIGSDHA